MLDARMPMRRLLTGGGHTMTVSPKDRQHVRILLDRILDGLPVWVDCDKPYRVRLHMIGVDED